MHSLPSADILFNDAACGLLVTTADGNILKVNQTFCQWLGYSAAELIDTKRLQDLFTTGGRMFHQTHWAPLLQMQGSVAEVHLDMVRRDGSYMPTMINARRRQTHRHEYIELAVFLANDRSKYERELLRARQQAEKSVAEMRKLQQELQQMNKKLSDADRRKDEFLATLAHELRNPLAPINNVLQVLTIKGSEDPSVIWARDILSRQAEHLTHLIDDLMDVSRISQARLTLRKTPLSLKPILLQSLEPSNALIESLGHELVVNIPDKEILIEADATRLIQIFSNLINNAVKYTPPGGKISLEVKLLGKTIEVRVSDSGIGIAPTQLDKVFEMFSQLKPALERTQEGLGIGLALVRGLVELHGGQIQAFSEGEGLGSQFVVKLPIYFGELEKPADSTGTSDSHAAHRILIVDDNVDAAKTLAAALDLLHYNTRFAISGYAGLAAGAQFYPQAVILDIGMPDINGYEVAKRIRLSDWGKNVLLIAATGWGQERDKILAKESGFDFHLTKPVDFSRLTMILRHLEK